MCRESSCFIYTKATPTTPLEVQVGVRGCFLFVTSVTCQFQGFDDNSGGTFDRTVFGWGGCTGSVQQKDGQKIEKMSQLKWRFFV